MNGVNRRESGDASASRPMAASTITRSKPGTGEQVFAIVVILYSTGAFSEFLKGQFDPQSYTGEGAPLTNTLWATVYVLVGWLLWNDRKHAIERLKGCPYLLFLTFLALLSAFWSAVPLYTMVRGMALIGTTLIGLYFATRFSLLEQLRLLSVALMIAAVLSYFMAFFVPSYGIGSGDFEGDWKGIFDHKNALGICMALGFLVCFLRFRDGGGAAGRFGVAAGLCGLLVLLSRSVTSVVVLIVMMFMLVGFRPGGLFRRRFSAWLAACWVVGLACGLSIAASRYLQILDYIGKDEKLTGRTLIWSFVWSNVVERPTLGFGYYAFWRGQEGPSAAWWDSTGSPIFHSHDGFLDVWVQLGLIGVVSLLIVLALSLRNAWRLVRSSSIVADSWPFLFLVLILGLSITEAGIMQTNNIYWIVCTAIAFTLGEARTWAAVKNISPSGSLLTNPGFAGEDCASFGAFGEKPSS